MKVAVVLLVVGALGTPSKALDKRLKTTDLRQRLLNYKKPSSCIPAELSEKLLRCAESC